LINNFSVNIKKSVFSTIKQKNGAKNDVFHPNNAL